MFDLGKFNPVPLRGGLCHFGLVKQMVVQDQQGTELYDDLTTDQRHVTHNTTCRPDGQGESEQAKGHRPQTDWVIERVYTPMYLP